MDIEVARVNMIESQVRTWEVLDQQILDLLLQVKREEFVPAQYRGLAFADMEIPIGHGEVMLQPKLEARMLQELGVRPGDRVLEVGTGSGYVTGLLSRLAREVFSIDVVQEFSESAKKRLASHGYANVTLEVGDAAAGWSRYAPYDAILMTGSMPMMPEELKAQLAVGGRMVAVIGRPPIMTAHLYTQAVAGAYNSIGLFETSIPPLKHARQPERFVF